MFFASNAGQAIRFICKTLLPALLGSMLLAPAATAGLMLHPTRLVFEKNQRAAQVDLINNGTENATYRVSVIERRMDENGNLVPVTGPADGERSAAAMIVFSPRQVTLAPGTSQTVRVMVRRPAGLEPGEYRSHLHFEKLPDATRGDSVEAAQDNKQIGIVLKVLVGASIPVIVRQGETSATVALSHLALDTAAKPRLDLDIVRSGNRSVYGDLAVAFAPAGGAEVPLGMTAGLALYTPNPMRRASVPLSVPPGVALAHGTVHVTYRERPDAGGKLIAEASLVLP